MEPLIKNHPFIDGNKRTAISSTGIFLQINGYTLETTQKELELFALSMATGKTSKEEVAEWFKRSSIKKM